MGPQGSGKGTQAKLLADRYGIPAISTGDIFRANIAGDTELGRRAKTYIEAGELVPDEVTTSMVRDRVAEDDTTEGFLLDGYPRTRAQVDALEAILQDLGKPLDAVIALSVNRNVLVERIKRRAGIEGRSDDTPEALDRRLAIYAQETAPLLDFYREHDLVVDIDGSQTPQEVDAALVAALDAKLGADA
ncbi:MAG: adenylate kinase [Cellulomonadaceae bacterium]|jgi:adenylate kinase|nr:adenylate kinase [Cellulomonadaceae bacterium]